MRSPEKENLKKLAMESETFEEFHSKTQKYDKLDREPRRIDHFTKKPKNLKATARQCLSFSEFHARTTEDKENDK